MAIHRENIASFQNGNSSQPGEGAIRHHYRDYDLKQLKKICDEFISKHNITVEFKHVKAHQDKPQNRTKDKNGDVILLSQANLMNIDCDEQAKEFYNQTEEEQSDQTSSQFSQ